MENDYGRKNERSNYGANCNKLVDEAAATQRRQYKHRKKKNRNPETSHQMGQQPNGDKLWSQEGHRGIQRSKKKREESSSSTVQWSSKETTQERQG